jgi:hypothetical protein
MREKPSSQQVDRWTLLTSVGQKSEDASVEKSDGGYQPFVTDGIVAELQPLLGKKGRWRLQQGRSGRNALSQSLACVRASI